MNNDLWLMSNSDIKALKADIKRQQKLGTQREQMAVEDYRFSLGDCECLRIHGPVISRPNWITEWLGLRTTEEHMDNLSDILSGGSNALLDIDTGGGDASLAFELADMIRSGGDRVIAYSGGYAASAGMLFLTAANRAFAHRSATLGSIGVVGYFSTSDSENVVYSDNARNKKSNKESVKRDINETEALFHEYVGTGTGLTKEQIITLGREGDIFSGEYAAANGFITETTTLQDLTNQSTIEGDTALATPKDIKDAQAEAMKSMAARFLSMTSIEGVPATVSNLVACNVAIDEADGKALLTAVATEISAAYERGKSEASAKPDDNGDDKDNKVEAPDQGAVMALLAQMQSAMSSSVNNVESDQTDGGDDGKSKEELAQEDWNARFEKMKAHAAKGAI